MQDKGPYDLIIANILPGPLKEMAADLVACADENSAVILSGILNEQAEDVLRVYQTLGLEHRKTLKNREWSTLLLRKTAS
ncbi:MAG: 50S ribosomal protein L11 methyltransferase [Rhodospirillales bacterium]|nr:50S ribosomal protein L11 methyltransferase [Rhodospirillales bacterium]